MEELEQISKSIQASTDELFTITGYSPVSGGCINQCFRINTDTSKSFFLKKNKRSFFPFFEAELLALQQIKETQTIFVPEAIKCEEGSSFSYLVLEFIKEGTSNPDRQKKMGQQLAKMHKHPKPYFGWDIDNCIGATPQPNPKSEDWIGFYRDFRLGHQFELAQNKGKSFNGSKDLMDNIDFFFNDYQPSPSLLHGDLWGGNSSFTENGTPFIYDPASYYGDRETDIAFTYMFGGYTPEFYEGYESTYPLDSGFSQRKRLYNLYHELNHFNLFGGGYANSAQASINQLTNLIP